VELCVGLCVRATVCGTASGIVCGDFVWNSVDCVWGTVCVWGGAVSPGSIFEIFDRFSQKWYEYYMTGRRCDAVRDSK
jgi:hypothetical protein